MKKTTIAVLIALRMVGCTEEIKNTQKDGEVEKASDIITDSSEIAFSKFMSYFTELGIDQYSTRLIPLFNKAASESDLKKVTSSLRIRYIPFVKDTNIFYGYKTLLTNKLVILIYNTSNVDIKNYLDTSFFTACIYNSKGKLLGHLNIAGSNNGDMSANYSLASNFENSAEGLKISLYKYYFPIDNLKEVYNSADSTYMGNLIMEQYFLDYASGNLAQQNITHQKAKMGVVLPTDSTALYLKLVEPTVDIKYQ